MLSASKGGDGDWKKHPLRGNGPEKEPPLITPPTKGQFRFSLWYVIAALVVILIINTFANQRQVTTVDYSAFKQKIESGDIKQVEISPNYLYGYTMTSEQMKQQNGKAGSKSSGAPKLSVYRAVPVNDPGFTQLLDKKGVEYYATSQKNSALLSLLLTWGIPILLLFVFWRILFRRMGQSGSNVLSFGNNKARIVAEGETGVTFNDVAGADECKEELMEVVDFLGNPRKYTEIGGKIPHGVLLVGSPGTGKTLLARAVAGEAHTPFFRISGADFVEMFVGVGASRVRDLFKQAREKAPCIIFIDELDALGKARLIGAGGNDEREQTLNQLLVEMDGFDARTGVIVLAATNRPEILDPALLRPGRFDRQIVVDKPDLTGREAILQIHAKGVKLAPDVDLHAIAKATPGFVGADLANVVNEAAILAVRNGHHAVEQKDLNEAIEKTIAGLTRKNRLINPREREIVAYHETGHAMVAALTPGADPVQKISIVPRGIGALGYTLQTPEEERFLMMRSELLGKVDVLLGGRAAEEIVFGDLSTGASNDLVKATDIVKRMITEFGMGDRFRNMTLERRRAAFLGEASEQGLQREYAESTQTYVDEEIARIIEERYEGVQALLTDRRELLEKIARLLLEKEIIEAAEFRTLMGL